MLSTRNLLAVLLYSMSLPLLASCPVPPASAPNLPNPLEAGPGTIWPKAADAPMAWPAPGKSEDWMGMPAGDPEVPALAGIMTIYTLPVGSGNCQMMLCPNQNRMIMFDCGSTGLGNLGWNRADVGQFIATQINDQTQIAVSISHPDADHSNYLPDVLAGRPISTIVMSRQPGDYPAAVRDWMANLQAQGTGLLYTGGIYRSHAPEPSLSCYAPDAHGGWNIDVPGYIVMMNAGATANDASMVIAQQYAGFQALFTGDMTGATEQQVNPVAPVALAGTRVITGAHHGAVSHGSNSQIWADANQASLVMFSSGTRFMHPRCPAVGVYWPYLFTDAAPHQFQCGNNGQWQVVNTQNAAFVTNNNGLIRVRVANNGQWDYASQFNGLAYLNAIELEAMKRANLGNPPDTGDCTALGAP
ncbi:hypothetical protein C7S18_17680 [Ahniella affigens]|uniref:Metallo-beta-lactamase domain-containing protein n=1 Tax=Ahniella affigens TaxID=2021234 RepID=A0A2P1PVM1_9GAMM|nr:hypothetical protein [Ahniella affigens]AVP98896.1 hypothetical protein C7S18_17680 [Ahniella affigens]